jgi:hypothetical protein
MSSAIASASIDMAYSIYFYPHPIWIMHTLT